MPSEWLSYDKVIELLLSKYPGLEKKEENYVSVGFKKDYFHSDLIFPALRNPIPLHVYLPEKAVDRKRLFTICTSYLFIEISEFDNNCQLD